MSFILHAVLQRAVTLCCYEAVTVCLCDGAVSDALDARKNPIIIDNTFVQQWEREQYIKLVGKP